MALVKCKECGAEISKKAKKCPQCGAPNKKKTSVFTLIVAGLFTFILFVFLFSEGTQQSMLANQPVPASPTKEEKNYDAKKAAIKKGIEDIFKSDKEKTAKDAIWTSDDMFKVAVIDNGRDRSAYADYVCEVLAEHKFTNQRVTVKIIDVVKLSRKEQWVELGSAQCR